MYSCHLQENSSIISSKCFISSHCFPKPGFFFPELNFNDITLCYLRISMLAYGMSELESPPGQQVPSIKNDNDMIDFLKHSI